jgi:predicted patatin/cPLA2 family phospholipase
VKLVLEGGGTRAAYGAGFVDALARAKVPVRAVIGCSSGAVNAAFFASGQTTTLCQLWAEIMPGKYFISWRRQFTPWGPPGLAVDDMLDRVIVGGQLLDCPAATRGSPALFVAVTELESGCGRLIQPSARLLIPWLRAALAIPVGYNRVVRVEGRDYVDGGVSMPVPFDEPIPTPEVGPTVVVLTRPLAISKAPLLWWQRQFVRTLVPRAARQATLRQHDLHNATMQRLRKRVQERMVTLVEPPAEMKLNRLTRDAGRIREGIELGREVGRKFAETWTPSCDKKRI